MAQYADVCNLIDANTVAHKIDVLRRHHDPATRLEATFGPAMDDIAALQPADLS